MEVETKVNLNPELLNRITALSQVTGIPSSDYFQNVIREFSRENSRVHELVAGSFSSVGALRAEIQQSEGAFSALHETVHESLKQVGEMNGALSQVLRTFGESHIPFKVLAGEAKSEILRRIAEFSLETDEEFASPTSSEVIDDPSGAPPETFARVELVAPSVRILRDLIAKGVSIAELHWRQFELLVAELLERDGFEVELGRGTKDGGVDIFARKVIPAIGPVLSVWQAKHHKKNPVQEATIRELADTRNQFGATKGVIVTSTRLTRGALDRIRRDQYLLEKVDGLDLEGWMRRTTPPRF